MTYGVRSDRLSQTEGQVVKAEAGRQRALGQEDTEGTPSF